MKNSEKDFGKVGHSTTKVMKSQKHEANLQRNSSLYFQIGLILCLFGTYALFEMQFQEHKIIFDTSKTNDLATIDYVEKFRVEPDAMPETKKEQVKRTVLIDKIIEVPDDFVINDPVDLVVSDPTPVIINPIAIADLPEDNKVEDENLVIPFIKIENAPVFPGCETYGTNEERRKCMSDQINKLINKRFDTNIGSMYGISGKQKISTQFTIDKFGNVIDVKVRGPHPALEREAKRVINQIPKMKPGIQHNVPVGVIYTLPIIYDAQI